MQKVFPTEQYWHFNNEKDQNFQIRGLLSSRSRIFIINKFVTRDIISYLQKLSLDFAMFTGFFNG